MQDLIVSTTELVQPGKTSFLKLRDDGEEKIIACQAIEVDAEHGDPHSTPILFEISQFSDSLADSLKSGTGVVNFHLHNGLLYALPGTVVESAAETTLKVKLLLPSQARGRSLRSNQRYSALGVYRLSPEDPLLSYSQTAPAPINISLGGFGLQTQNFEIAANSEYKFALKVIIDNNGQPHPAAPVLELSGVARARYVMTLDSEQTAYCGFKFTDIPDESLGALAFWIKTHEALLRSV